MVRTARTQLINVCISMSRNELSFSCPSNFLHSWSVLSMQCSLGNRRYPVSLALIQILPIPALRSSLTFHSILNFLLIFVLDWSFSRILIMVSANNTGWYVQLFWLITVIDIQRWLLLIQQWRISTMFIGFVVTTASSSVPTHWLNWLCNIGSLKFILEFCE